MNTGQPEPINHRTPDWPLPRLIAFSAMMFTMTSISIFIIIAFFLNITQTVLSKESLLLPVLGTLLVSGTLAALLGLTSGVIDLTRSRDRRGITVVSVVFNSFASLLVFAIIISGLAVTR